VSLLIRSCFTVEAYADIRFRNYEALQRENAALKQQLANGYQIQTSPPLQDANQTYERAALPLEHFRSHDGPNAGNSTPFQRTCSTESRQSYPAEPDPYYDTRVQEPLQLRKPSRAEPEAVGRAHLPGVQPNSKRAACEAGLRYAHIACLVETHRAKHSLNLKAYNHTAFRLD
jgi:hypothetical protein